jgi:hypothetical protein
MKEELKEIKHAIDGLSDEMLEHRRHANMEDLIKVMKSIDQSLCSISFDLKDLVQEKKMQNELTMTLG